MVKRKDTPTPREWTTREVTELAERSEARGKANCMEQMICRAQSYEAANSRDGRLIADAFRRFVEEMTR